jgi:hypothetical protein
METAVRKATRLEYRPPKEKHLLSKAYSTFSMVAVVIKLIPMNSTKEFDYTESSLYR